MRKKWLCIRLLCILVVLSLISLLIYGVFFGSPSHQVTTIVDPSNEKYITSTYKSCNGLGNVMYRFASLYGIGRKIKRRPYWESSLKCNRQYMIELKSIFPNAYKHLRLLNSKSEGNRSRTVTEFAMTCCDYDEPKRLSKIDTKYLIIKGNELQAYGYFHGYRNYIREFFTCDYKVLNNVHEIANNLFKDDLNHKLCVHIRRGDFIYTGLMESQEDFTLGSLKFALNHLKELEIALNVSVVFIGDDQKFMHKIGKQIKPVYYIPERMSRGEDHCFGTHYCNSLVITAGGSTFAWWIGYMMKSDGPVFYNVQITKPDNRNSLYFNKMRFDYEGFPHTWIRLEMNGTEVVYDPRWYIDKIREYS